MFCVCVCVGIDWILIKIFVIDVDYFSFRFYQLIILKLMIEIIEIIVISRSEVFVMKDRWLMRLRNSLLRDLKAMERSRHVCLFIPGVLQKYPFFFFFLLTKQRFISRQIVLHSLLSISLSMRSFFLSINFIILFIKILSLFIYLFLFFFLLLFA